MVEGYQRRTRSQGVYFRELYALLYNVNRGEKAEYLNPAEVLILPGDKSPKKAQRKPRPKTAAELIELERLMNQ